MSYSIDLSGRVALVTGAGSGFGRQFARALAKAGAAVVLAGRDLEELKTLRSDIEGQGGDAHAVRLDVTDVDDIKAAVAHAETEVGTLDILVNNCAVSVARKLSEVHPEEWDHVMAVNARGAFFVAQEVGKRMIARARGAAPGTYTGGRIVNIASSTALRAVPQLGLYGMSKALVVHMTRTMAQEWGRYDITVNAVCPGVIDHGANQEYWQSEAGQKALQNLPRKRLGKPKDLDTSLLMLCAKESHFINGAVIPVDDGQGL
jgi:NAD(P)-dependent dehydrogenase (short-subunit alcohol dehydrogenase family)